MGYLAIEAMWYCQHTDIEEGRGYEVFEYLSILILMALAGCSQDYSGQWSASKNNTCTEVDEAIMSIKKNGDSYEARLLSAAFAQTGIAQKSASSFTDDEGLHLKFIKEGRGGMFPKPTTEADLVLSKTGGHMYISQWEMTIKNPSSGAVFRRVNMMDAFKQGVPNADMSNGICLMKQG